VADLRLALQRAEQQQAKKEDYLREEISELQQVTRAHYRQLTRIDVYIYLFISFQPKLQQLTISSRLLHFC